MRNLILDADAYQPDHAIGEPNQAGPTEKAVLLYGTVYSHSMRFMVSSCDVRTQFSVVYA